MNPPLVFTNDDIEGKKIKQGKRDKKPIYSCQKCGFGEVIAQSTIPKNIFENGMKL